MGDTLYTATADGQGLGIIDMSDPANLVLANMISTEGYMILEMSASDRYLIVISQKATATTQAGTTFSKRLQIYDVSDPFQPAEVGRVEPVGDAFGFTLVGDTIYATASDSYENFYLVVLDISDPAHPVEVGRFVLPSYVTEMVPAGDIIYMSTDDGIWALNVSDPSYPYLAGHLQLPGRVSGMSVAGDLLYVVAGDTGLFITSVPTSGSCRNDSVFVLDVNVPDGTHIAPGASFTKTWRLWNSGTCTWDASYRFDFISGEQMNGPESTALGETVLPGAEVDISIALMAPQADGTYRGQWQLVAPDGTAFGAKPYVEIVAP
jgi:hypothetical protein